jgi:hypothetical protein
LSQQAIARGRTTGAQANPPFSSSKAGQEPSCASPERGHGADPRVPSILEAVADLPVNLPPDLAVRLAAVLDTEGKIPRALDALGPLRDRDVVLVDGDGGLRAAQLADLGARVQIVDSGRPDGYGLATASADILIACWSAFRGFEPTEMAEAERVVRPGGRLLVVHDYGRDDVSHLHDDAADRPEYGLWSRRDGPFLRSGFKVRVVHCWWSFDSVESARIFVSDAFGDTGRRFAEDLRRPRLSYNIAVYHRSVGNRAVGAVDGEG